MRLLIATENPGKIREIRLALEGLPLTLNGGHRPCHHGYPEVILRGVGRWPQLVVLCGKAGEEPAWHCHQWPAPQQQLAPESLPWKPPVM